MNGEGLGVTDFGERTSELAGRYSSSVRKRLDVLEPVRRDACDTRQDAALQGPEDTRSR